MKRAIGEKNKLLHCQIRVKMKPLAVNLKSDWLSHQAVIN